MRALIYKDFVASKGSYLLVLLVSVVFGVLAFSQGQQAVLPATCLLMSSILIATSFGVEIQSNSPMFIFTTPISRKKYTSSKYIVAIFFSVLAFILAFVVSLMSKYTVGAAFFSGVLASIAPSLFASVQLPLIIKFGAEKGRIISVASFAIIFAGFNVFADMKEELIDLIQKIRTLNLYLLGVIMLVCSFVVLLVSIKVSQKIVRQKEY
jgi:ABC-type transport system involved in multi-copper enzyme maturation permease subunit